MLCFHIIGTHIRQLGTFWQEFSARIFVPQKSVASQEYWMYFKKLHCICGAKGPARTEATNGRSCRKQTLPKEQNSQAFPTGNEDCKRMWLWRSSPGGSAEGATRGPKGCANLSGKRTEFGTRILPRPWVWRKVLVHPEPTDVHGGRSRFFYLVWRNPKRKGRIPHAPH